MIRYKICLFLDVGILVNKLTINELNQCLFIKINDAYYLCNNELNILFINGFNAGFGSRAISRAAAAAAAAES